MIKFEVVITAWEDGLFKSRKRIELTEELFEYEIDYLRPIKDSVEEMSERIHSERNSRMRIAKDDDIPF